MKLFTKTYIALFVLILSFLSCNIKLDLKKAGPDPIIKITGCNGSKLILSDNGKTTTTRANIVFWEIEATCIKSIDTIIIKDNSPITTNRFFAKGDPRRIDTKNPLSKWRGRINPYLTLRNRKGKTKRWFYSIKWTGEDDVKHIYDPEIEVNEYYEE